MRVAVWYVGSILAMASCTSPGKPAAAEPDPDSSFVCGQLGHGALYAFHASAPALDAAQAAYDAASAVDDDHARAAHHYLACAAAYRAIPDDFAELGHALANARLCYQAAIIAYSNGQLLAREGRAAVTAALADEPRADVKAELEAVLASQHDCGAE